MIEIGQYHTLRIIGKTPEGYMMEQEGTAILLPKYDAPKALHVGEELRVFLYQDNDGRIIATTKEPRGVVGDIVLLRVADVTDHGAFMDWGLRKDLFVPESKQLNVMRVDHRYLVKIYRDPKSGKLAATEKLDQELSNEELTVQELEVVDMIVFRRTDLGYAMIINNKHLGLLHYNEVFKELEVGDRVKGFIKKIKEENRMDVMIGKPGHTRIEDETDPILKKLEENDGYLPFHDKSAPEDIYRMFGMSKKTFKMTIGNLYKKKKITIEENGIRLV